MIYVRLNFKTPPGIIIRVLLNFYIRLYSYFIPGYKGPALIIPQLFKIYCLVMP